MQLLPMASSPDGLISARYAVINRGGGGTRKHREAGCGRPEDGGVGTAKTVKRPPQQPAQPPTRQLLGAANAQTAHPATSSTPRHIQHSPGTPTTGIRERGNDASRSTGRSGQNAATRRNMRREDRVTVQGPVKKQPPDGMSHRGGGGAGSEANKKFVYLQSTSNFGPL